MAALGRRRCESVLVLQFYQVKKKIIRNRGNEGKRKGAILKQRGEKEIRKCRVEDSHGACNLLQVECDWTEFEVFCPLGWNVWRMEIRTSSHPLLLFPWQLHCGVMVVNT